MITSSDTITRNPRYEKQKKKKKRNSAILNKNSPTTNGTKEERERELQCSRALEAFGGILPAVVKKQAKVDWKVELDTQNVGL